jgi:hypothetical protein
VLAKNGENMEKESDAHSMEWSYEVNENECRLDGRNMAKVITPLKRENCRAIVGGKKQCANLYVYFEGGVGVCRIHYSMLQRGKKLAYKGNA